VSPFDATPRRLGANQLHEQNMLASNDFVEERVLTSSPSTNAARGIVWADVLAEIAADEEARQLRAAQTRQLRDAA
jgi:hypothetical protein